MKIASLLYKTMFFYGLLHMDAPRLADQQELILALCRTLDVVWRTCRERWMIGTDGEKESQENPCCQRDLIIIMVMVKFRKSF